MAAGKASVFVGGRPWPDTTIEVDGTAYEIQASNGGLYLYHPTAAYSFVDQLATHVTTERGGTTTCHVQQDGKLYISNDAGGTWTLEWIDALGKTFSGFTQGDLSGATEYTADDVSPFLFRPGRTETAMDGVLGAEGRPVFDVVGGVSRDGTVGAAVLGSQIVDRLIYTHVATARYQDNDDLDRHFRGWWEQVGVRGRNFLHFREVDEDDASTSAISWPTALGPYAVDLASVGGRLPGRRTPGFERVEAYYNIELPIHKVPEYTS